MRTVILLADTMQHRNRGIVDTVGDIRAARFQGGGAHGGGGGYNPLYVAALDRDGTYGDERRYRVLDKDPLLGLNVVIRSGRGAPLSFERHHEDAPSTWGHGAGMLLPENYYSGMDNGNGVPAGRWVFEIEVTSSPRMKRDCTVIHGADEESRRHVALLAGLAEAGVLGKDDQVYTPWMEGGIHGSAWGRGDTWVGLREDRTNWYSRLLARRVVVNGFEAINVQGLVEYQK